MSKPDLSKQHFLLFPVYEHLAAREAERERQFWLWVERPLPEEDPPPYDWEALEAAMDRLIARGEDPNLTAAEIEHQAWLRTTKIERVKQQISAHVDLIVTKPPVYWAKQAAIEKQIADWHRRPERVTPS